MRYALGIDGGGSKCDAVLMDEAGIVVGWGRGGPVHGYYDPPEIVAASYADAVIAALGDLQAAEIWVGGPSMRGRAREAIAAAGSMVQCRHGGEVDTAFASVQEDWGMVVLAGTGSFAYARTADGESLHFGGMGPILGDYGSAYWIGLYGLRAAFASAWSPERRTSLAEALPRAMGVPDLPAVFSRVYVERIARREIAAVARVVDREAEAGDSVAAMCLLRAADDLAQIAADVILGLDMRAMAFPVIAIGSVAQRSRMWWARVCERILEMAPNARPIVPRLRPAVGAALLALREMGIEWSPEIVERIETTQTQFLEGLDAESVPQTH